MRLYLLIITFHFFDGFSQGPSGRFFDGDDVFIFTNDSLEFKIKSNSGTCMMRGIGKYQILNKFLVLQTGPYHTTSKVIFNSGETKPAIKIIDENNKNLELVNLIIKDSHDKTIKALTTDTSGLIKMPLPKSTSKIKASTLCDDQFTFDYLPDRNCTVLMVDGRIIVNSTMIFEIVEMTESELKLILLNLDDKCYSPSQRQLNTIYKKKKKDNERVRTFKK